MKKLLKLMLVSVLLIIVAGASILIYQGHAEYERLVQEHPLEQVIRQVQSDEDYTQIEEISSYLLDATVSVEDKNFYSHGGVDLAGVTRAVLSNLLGIGEPSGATTSSSYPNLYSLFYDQSLTRKITEAFLTYELEGICTKDEILELYVNVINYGDGYAGIREASIGYFGKEPSQLTLDEASLLAGIPQSPANFQLSDHMENARAKQEVVLEAMVREEKITQEEMDGIIGSGGQSSGCAAFFCTETTFLIAIVLRFMYNKVACPSGETGRRNGLKIYFVEC
ncbi:MAG: biosynthetic peptidoglycan transglycosylase [Merdibacter sp.]